MSSIIQVLFNGVEHYLYSFHFSNAVFKFKDACMMYVLLVSHTQAFTSIKVPLQ